MMMRFLKRYSARTGSARALCGRRAGAVEYRDDVR